MPVYTGSDEDKAHPVKTKTGPQYFQRKYAINPYTGNKVYEGSPEYAEAFRLANIAEKSGLRELGNIATGGKASDPYSQYYQAPENEGRISADSRQLTASYLRDFPAILAEIRRQIPQFERQQLGLAQELSPQYAKTQRELYKHNLRNVAGNERDILQRFAPDITRANLAQDQILNPEFYSSRANTAAQLNDLLSNGLSGSELSAIERGNNRQFENAGVGGLPIRSKEVESAINYGQAGRDRLTQALQIATQTLPTLRSPVQGYKPPPTTDIAGAFQNVKGDIGESTANLAKFNPLEGATQLSTAEIGKPRKNDSFNLGLSL